MPRDVLGEDIEGAAREGGLLDDSSDPARVEVAERERRVAGNHDVDLANRW